jgi:hypothetical protein
MFVFSDATAIIEYSFDYPPVFNNFQILALERRECGASKALSYKPG